MQPLGAKLAEGRDSEIFEHGPGRVLRVAKERRDLEPEARIMNWVRERGYPAPEVFDAGDGWLVMERLDGLDMVTSMPKTPGGVRRTAAALAALHNQLAAMAAPGWLEPAPGPPGDSIVHLDLHPLNVMMTTRGPVLIDWSNARRGLAAMDVANTWALLKSGEIPQPIPLKWFLQLGRGLFLNDFLDHVDRGAASAVLPAVVEWRHTDMNMSARELARMRRLSARVSA